MKSACLLQIARRQVPSFLVSWHLYLSSIATFDLPNYDILHKLLRNSWTHWPAELKFAGQEEDDITEDVSSGSDHSQKPAKKRARLEYLLAAEE